MGFVPGLELNRRFYTELIAPLLAARFPGLRYAAGRLDFGSELLGFDTPRSTDHDWGPRVQLFLDGADPALAQQIVAAFSAELPATFLDHPTRFAHDGDTGFGVLSAAGDRHGVTVSELGAWFEATLGFDPRRRVSDLDWLSAPTQRLAEVTGGAVFHDGLDGTLTAARDQLAWYPDDVWRYVLACQWSRIGREEHVVGRCGEVGDELGSAMVAARLARDLMRLCLLLARRYPPYNKWLGSAFARLPGAEELVGALRNALAASDWRTRERWLSHAYEEVATRMNDTGLAEPVDPRVRCFHNRPFLVLDAGRFTGALRAAITNPWLRRLPPVGAVDQYLDSTDLVTATPRTRAVVSAALAH
ncbi:protein of unknown function [Micromonospora pattaloongensis]|uniref:DUF4037 domain-containing protein n=1 Tax=Micromonospora pattaloongensis TaxID=405436 RepID=A0A1H3P746_9ACTN|nr:DUF4037 domain-containing protein [Micromonospora pattaloongensis]SDY96994.1 protein of unknown function [Micromonospora pattaloongensis]